MYENEFSPVGKVIVSAAVAVGVPLALLQSFDNAAQGILPHPWALMIVLAGFSLFLVPKLIVVRRQAWISFGTRYMSEDQANAYRVGYWLMVLGILSAFLPWSL